MNSRTKMKLSLLNLLRRSEAYYKSPVVKYQIDIITADSIEKRTYDSFAQALAAYLAAPCATKPTAVAA